MFPFALVLALAVTASPAAAQKPDPDEKILATYRLTMPTIKKMAAVNAALQAEEKKDPAEQELAKLTAEIDALESKDELTAADEARLEALRERAEALVMKMDAEDDSGDDQTIAGMEARLRKDPRIVAAMTREGITPREYVTAMLALMQAAMVDAFSEGKADLTKLPPGVNPENVKFVREHKAELEALQSAFGTKKK